MENDHSEEDFKQAIRAYHKGDFETAVSKIRPMAQQGDAASQFLLGMIYATANGGPFDPRQAIKRNPQEAIKWYQLAAEQGYTDAQFSLGNIYEEGNGVPQNPEEALKWYRLNAEKGSSAAKIKIGLAYAEGNGVPQDPDEALKWFLLAQPLYNHDVKQPQSKSDAKSPQPIDVPQPMDIDESWDEFIDEVNMPLPRGQSFRPPIRTLLRLGMAYEKGKRIPHNFDQAVKCYMLAAQQGYADALFSLGLACEKGDGVPQDFKEPIKWYRLLAEQGSKEAQFKLGLAYEKGEGVPQNFEEAVKWYELAAEPIYEMLSCDTDLGFADAQFQLGVAYEQGKGVPKNFEEAVKWYRLAAGNGNHTAQLHLAKIFPPPKQSDADYIFNTYAEAKSYAVWRAQESCSPIRMERRNEGWVVYDFGCSQNHESPTSKCSDDFDDFFDQWEKLGEEISKQQEKAIESWKLQKNFHTSCYVCGGCGKVANSGSMCKKCMGRGFII